MEFYFAAQVGDIGGRAGGEVIEDGDLIASGDQSIGKVGADKTCTTGDKYAHKGSLRAEVEYLVTLFHPRHDHISIAGCIRDCENYG